jgi:hypothetical protein
MNELPLLIIRMYVEALALERAESALAEKEARDTIDRLSRMLS